MATHSVRTRSASPKSVSFSPQLTRKYSAERPVRAQPTSPAPALGSSRLFAPGFEWRLHFHDFSSYLDALLADLQNSISPHGGSAGGRGPSPATPGYGSLNGARSGSAHGYHSPKAQQSPTYQNQNVGSQEKIIPVSKHYSESQQSPKSGSLGRAGLRPVNNNLSELDNLLQDLSNAKYTSHGERPGSGNADRSGYGDRSYGGRTDGYGKTNGAVSPASSLGRSISDTLHRHTVDSLLDQLNSDITNGSTQGQQSPKPGGPVKHVKVTVEETVVEPVQGSQAHKYTHVQPVTHTHASNATRELDDLMASLSDFKVSQGGGVGGTHHTIVPAPSSPNTPKQHVYKSTHAWQEHSRYQTTQPSADGNLESMLGSLRADMSRQGVQTTQKGCCNACDKPIVGQVITALGRTWHPEHFTCAHCSQELGTRNFFERDGKPYCEPDYHNLFSPRCAYCNGPILDKCVTALEKTWHTEHFFCAQCGQQFGEDGFHERDGKPYCRNDYFDMFAPKCGGCNRPIMENYISALNSQWHPNCFVCRDCRQPFLGGSFFDHEGQPYCETHYHAKRGSLCAGCHKPIAGRCITAMFRKFHPEHFVCAFCLKQLNKGTFKEQNEKPYCHACFEKLFG